MAAHAADPPTWPAMLNQLRASAALPQRHDLLAQAEQALARGDTLAAIQRFELAGTLLHAADSEMGLVRAWMQAGEYRRALAFCAHAAGAHRDTPAASALYAWLLRIGGQVEFARSTLAQASRWAPGDPVVEQVRQAFDSGALLATGDLLGIPHRMAPLGSQPDDVPPPVGGARVTGTGVLLPGGRLALVPLAALRGGKYAWARNGLGRTTLATVLPAPEALTRLGVSLAHLSDVLDEGSLPFASRDPFPGSPGFAVSFPAQDDAAPAWPVLQQGFLGAGDGLSGARRLGFGLAAGATTGLVIDATGDLAGIAIAGPDGRASLLPPSLLRPYVGGLPPTEAAGTAAPPRIGADEAYQRAMRSTLQLIAPP